MSHEQQEQYTGQEPASLPATVYMRISDDPEGTERGVERQEADCRAYAAAHGWEVVAVFKENDTSAFKQRTITLPSGERARQLDPFDHEPRRSGPQRDGPTCSL